MTVDYESAVSKIEAALCLVTMNPDADPAIIGLLDAAKASLNKGRFLDSASLSRRWSGITPKTLSNQRSAGTGPKFIRPVGQKQGSAIYSIAEIEAYEKHLFQKGETA